MALTNAYCTLQDLKDALRITDDVDDLALELSIDAASRQIDNYCERVFYQTTTTRVFAPRDSFVCEIDDLVSLTTLKTSTSADGVFDVTWSSADYQLEPLNGIAGGIPFPATQIRAIEDYWFPTANDEATVQVAGVFGWSEVPNAVKFATILLASRLFKRLDAPLGVAGFGDLGVIRVSRIDPDIEALVSPFRKMRMA